MAHGGFYQRFGIFKRVNDLMARRNVRLSDAFYLNLLAVVIGVLVALFVFCFKYAVNLVGDAIRGDGAGNQLPLFAEHNWLIYLVPALGGLIVGLIFLYFGGDRRFRGVASVMESVARRGGRLGIRKGAVELLNSGISIASGLSVGMEGPIVVAGSTIGSNVAAGFKLSAARRRMLLACGAAAGISAVFNAPIAGFFFALELILGDFSKKAVAAIVLASVSANVTITALTEGGRIFDLPSYGEVLPAELVYYAILGLICGVVAYCFAQFLHFCDYWFPKLKIYKPFRPMLGGLIVAAIAFFFPEILGTGHHTVEMLLSGHYPADMHLFDVLRWENLPFYLVALAAAKLVATSVTLGSGAAGGKFAPSLFIGSTIGGAFGVLVASQSLIPAANPEAGSNPAAYALVGMAAIFGSIAQIPLTVILLVFEMTGDYKLILPMMTAGVLSQVVFHTLRPDGVFTHKLTQMGVKFGRGKDLNILEAIPVSRSMHRGVETINAGDSLESVRRRFADTQHHGFPVVDDEGRLCGVFTTSDLASHQGDAPDATAIDACTRVVHSLKADDDCHKAIALLEDHHIGRVPVVDDENRPIGIITRTDIIGAYKLALQEREQELREQGG